MCTDFYFIKRAFLCPILPGFLSFKHTVKKIFAYSFLLFFCHNSSLETSAINFLGFLYFFFLPKSLLRKVWSRKKFISQLLKKASTWIRPIKLPLTKSVGLVKLSSFLGDARKMLSLKRKKNQINCISKLTKFNISLRRKNQKFHLSRALDPIKVMYNFNIGFSSLKNNYDHMFSFKWTHQIIEAFFGLLSFLFYFGTVFVSRRPFGCRSFVYEKKIH